MELKDNENKIRLSGIACINGKLNLETDIDLTIKAAEVVSKKIIPNNDGTQDTIFAVKITERSEINILAENEILKAKKKGSQSQKLRTVLMELWNEQYSGEIEFEDYYTKEMSGIIESYKERLL
jgi:hypothetical protein